MDNPHDGEKEGPGNRPVQFTVRDLLMATVAICVVLSAAHLLGQIIFIFAIGVAVGGLLGRWISGVRAGWLFGSFLGGFWGLLCWALGGRVLSQAMFDRSSAGPVFVEALMLLGGSAIGGIGAGAMLRPRRDPYRTAPLSPDPGRAGHESDPGRDDRELSGPEPIAAIRRRALQFSLRSLMLATVIAAVLLGLICSWEAFGWLLGAWIIGGVTGRVVAGKRIGWFVGGLSGTVTAGTAVLAVGVAVSYFRRSWDIGAMMLAILAAYVVGAALGGAIGGRDARARRQAGSQTDRAQRNVSSSRSRAASTEKET